MRRLLHLRALAALCLVLLALPAQTRSNRHADPALEALLPRTLGGTTLTVESQAGADLSTDSAAFDAFLKSQGKTRRDFTVASAYPQGGLPAAVGAWRIAGAKGEALLPAFQAAIQASSATRLDIGPDELAGRRVTRIGGEGQLTQGPIYVVARDDTLLFVQASRRELAEEAMSKLPRD
jgi:hypothetical protein